MKLIHRTSGGQIGAWLVFLHIAALCWPLSTHAQESCAAAPSEPDIILIMLDDLDYTDISAFRDLFNDVYGNLEINTPMIDGLAEEGLSFTQYYALGPVCSPTRASMLSGAFPGHLGVRRAITKDSFRGLPFDLETMPEMLQNQCYTTLHVGKWHLGFQKDGFLPSQRSFDRTVRRIGGTYENYEVSIDGGPAESFSIGDGDSHLTQYLTDQAIELYKSAPEEQPLFLNLWYYAPHGPIQPPAGTCSITPAEVASEEDRLALFACLVNHVDQQIGRLLATIAENKRGRANNTLVIFTSDNGGTVNNHHVGNRRLLNGNKTQVFEGGIRVPMIVRWPAEVPSWAEGMTNESQITSFDFYPTFADISDYGSLGGHVEGQSFLDILETNVERPRVSGREQLVWETKRSTQLVQPIPEIWNTFAVREERFKYVYQDGTEYFFDIAGDGVSDPDLREENNLVGQYATQAAEFRDNYFDWREGSDIAYAPPVPMGNATLVGDLLTFAEDAAGGGYAEIGAVVYGGQSTVVDPRFDFHDGDFSFTTRIVNEGELGDKRVIARKQGSWRLLIDEAGHLKLIVVGGPTDDPNLQGPAVLVAPNPLPVDPVTGSPQEVHVGFTVFGLRKGPSVIRLFVDGKQEVLSSDQIATVNPSDESVRLGNNQSLSAPFDGTMTLPRVSVNSLYPCEVCADSRDEPARLHCPTPQPACD